MNSPCLYVEIGQSSLKVLEGDNGLELPLDRQDDGRLTNSCKERLAAGLQRFLKQKSRRHRQHAYCAIAARGVSLRRVVLPSSTREEQQRLLLLQIETEFPLPPDELAWGCSQLNQENLPANGATANQELLVVAVKKDVIEEYAEILTACGLDSVFTLGALARRTLCRQPPGSFAILDIGLRHSELIAFERGAAVSVRILAWGGEDLTRAIEQKLQIGRDEAEKLKTNPDAAIDSDAGFRLQIQDALRAELSVLARFVNGIWTGPKLYLSGKSARLQNLAPWLAAALGGGIECERLEELPGEGSSAATLGLRKSSEQEGEHPLPILQHRREKVREVAARPDTRTWAIAAVALAIGALLTLRYGETILSQPRLARTLKEMKTYRERLPNVDRELSFLQFLQTNQPPHLEALFVLANAAAPGTRFDSLSMNRAGNLSFRGTMPSSQQATDFRSKLIDSGFFSSVVLEEQNPSPDRPKVTVRFSAQWKSTGARAPVAGELSRPEADKPKSSGKELKSVAPGKADVPPPPGPEAGLPPGTLQPQDRGPELPPAAAKNEIKK
ncbi:MAG: pilus assembly protein PilM [Chloroflexi bacterium]|nr:pilus assembly protein PilM [Chloroflexota bacterium]